MTTFNIYDRYGGTNIKIRSIALINDDDLIRAILHTIIMVLLLVENNVMLNLICDKRVIEVITCFINTNSERKRLDNKSYHS